MGDVSPIGVNRGIPNRNIPVPQYAGKNVKFLQPEIVEKRNWELKHAKFALILAVVLMLIQFGVMTLMDLEATQSWIIAFVLIITFGIAIYFMLEPRKEREIRQRIVETNLQTIERPTVKEVTKFIEVDKPMIKEVPVYTEPRTVYLAKSRGKTRKSIKYDFVGSKLTKVYHRSSCRLGKSIAKKHKIRGISKAFFKRLGYKACSVCKPNKF